MDYYLQIEGADIQFIILCAHKFSSHSVDANGDGECRE